MSGKEEAKRDPVRVWYCVRTRAKAEHIAAAHLRQLEGVEVFCPRIRYRKATLRGRVWFTEALFPGYLLASFDLGLLLRAVSSARQVTKVVAFGGNYPSIADEIVAELKREVDDNEIVTLEDPLLPGDVVKVTEGPMMGMSAVVKRLLPAKQRVQILLEILGREREVEVDQVSVSTGGRPRNRIAAK